MGCFTGEYEGETVVALGESAHFGAEYGQTLVQPFAGPLPFVLQRHDHHRRAKVDGQHPNGDGLQATGQRQKDPGEQHPQQVAEPHSLANRAFRRA